MRSAEHLKKYAFPKGVSANPGGKPKWLLTKGQVEQAFQAFHSMTKEELIKVRDDDKSLAMHAMIASIMIKTIEHGDQSRMQFLLDRAIGKVPQIVTMSDEEIVLDEIKALSDEQLIELAKQKIPQLEGPKPTE